MKNIIKNEKNLFLARKNKILKKNISFNKSYTNNLLNN